MRSVIEEVDEEELNQQREQENIRLREQASKEDQEWELTQTSARVKENKEYRGALGRAQGAKSTKRAKEVGAGRRVKKRKHEILGEDWGEQINPSSSFIPDTAPVPLDIGEHHNGEKTPPTVLASHLHQPREEQLGSREFKQTLLTSIFQKVKEVQREPTGRPCIPSHKTQADTFESSMIPGQEVGKDTKCSGSANTINTIVDCNEDGCNEENKVSMGVENKVSTAPSVCTNDKLLDIEKTCVDAGGLCSIHQTVITYRKVKSKKWKDRGKGRGFGWVPTNVKKSFCGNREVLTHQKIPSDLSVQSSLGGREEGRLNQASILKVKPFGEPGDGTG